MMSTCEVTSLLIIDPRVRVVTFCDTCDILRNQNSRFFGTHFSSRRNLMKDSVDTYVHVASILSDNPYDRTCTVYAGYVIRARVLLTRNACSRVLAASKLPYCKYLTNLGSFVT